MLERWYVASLAVLSPCSSAPLSCQPQLRFSSPYRTRGGPEALAHVLRCLTDADDEAIIVSLDDVGAYDHVQRIAFLTKLAKTPSL